MGKTFIKVTFIHQVLFILFISIARTIAPCRAHRLGNETDHVALLAIKSQLLDHSAAGVFRSWNHSLHHCSWDGVTCGPKHDRVIVLDLSSRGLVGTISPFIGNLSFLQDIELQDNSLVGHIPPELGRLFRLQSLYLYNNTISGEIPANLSACLNLEELSVGINKLEGKLPLELRVLSKLRFLSVDKNSFSGALFETITNMTSIQVVSAGESSFTGHIQTNIVPTSGVFTNISAFSVDGNVKLCGGLPELHLPRCKKPREMKKGRKTLRRALKLIVCIICALVGVLIITTWLYFTCHKKKRVPTSSGLTKDELMKVSYDMLFKATNGFSSENLVGFGSFGSVFRGILDGDTVAVKVLNLQTRGASKSFMAECKALRNVRHRNLVGIITACSSIDNKRNDFKALIYKFMPNGSLDEWLHGNRVENITLLQRVDIAIDVAHALSYLHHDCEFPIVHCDLKPTNVLLDEDMVACVGDFGLAKFLAHPQHLNQSSSIGVRGTVGYAAPEYGLGNEPCLDGDIYSYGILVLELMTGKRPTDNMFQEDYNLHSYTETTFPDNVLEIVDPTLLEDNIEISDEEVEEIRATQATNQQRYECMVDVMSVGVGCSKHLPQDRMEIKEAISKLQSAKDNLGNGRRNRHYTIRGQNNDMN